MRDAEQERQGAVVNPGSPTAVSYYRPRGSLWPPEWRRQGLLLSNMAMSAIGLVWRIRHIDIPTVEGSTAGRRRHRPGTLLRVAPYRTAAESGCVSILCAFPPPY